MLIHLKQKYMHALPVYFPPFTCIFCMSRGGGGVPSWHRSGSGLHKLNSIHDFVSCGEFLVNEGYVCKDKLGAIGHSAGCLLVAAAINMYPDLFRAAIMKVSSYWNMLFLYSEVGFRVVDWVVTWNLMLCTSKDARRS